MTGLVLALDAAVAASLFARHRARWLFPVAAAGLAIALIVPSQPRLVGDSGEYIAMALNLGQGHRPSLTAQDLADATAYVPGDAGTVLVQPEYRGADGRQDFSHFWFYSLLASPFVRAAVALDKNPIDGFTMINALLLFCAALVVERRAGAAPAALIVLGPVLWWLDKAHTEVFTVSLLAIAVACLDAAPWWSIAALGVAATQNPPIAGAMALVVLYAARKWGVRDRRVLFGTLAGVSLAAMHPLYFHWRLGVWSGLSFGLDRHWPSSQELLAVPADLNIGMFVHDPFIAVAAAAAFIVAFVRNPRGLGRDRDLVIVLAGVLFLFSFTQTGNFNSGGTPGPSRYGLWLLPLALPALASASATWWMRAMAIASLVWCSSHFAPALHEMYLQPTSFAARVWHADPQFDNPLAEIFAERVSGREPSAKPPIATSDCEKVLVVGDGQQIGWPDQCAALVPNAPSECREWGEPCYANRTLTSYSFTRAPASPAWLVWERRPETTPDAPAVAQDALTLPPAEAPRPTLWLGDGWSYVEHALGVPADVATWRWMGDRAAIDVVMPAAGRRRVRLVLGAFAKTRRLRISLNATVVAVLNVTEGPHGYDTDASFAAGSNSLLFESLDGTASSGAQDKRQLSVALFHADVTQ